MTPDIAEVERVPAGLFITFEDGRSAIYSTLLLYELLPNGRPVTQQGEPEFEESSASASDARRPSVVQTDSTLPVEN